MEIFIFMPRTYPESFKMIAQKMQEKIDFEIKKQHFEKNTVSNRGNRGNLRLGVVARWR